MAKATTNEITKSSTAEYFAKNLQQVGFSSPAKAVLTTLKEAVDNALDACEEFGVLPDINVYVRKMGKGSLRNTDRILIRVDDNGPGLDSVQVPMVFGEYLASSKFGRGRCSRGQQGIGISAATTWAVQTTATGARIITKQPGKRKALACLVVTDLKNNKGIMKDKEMIDWERPHGTSVEYLIDGRLQMNGEGGILAYLRGSVLLNPHLSLTYDLPDLEPVTIKRVSTESPKIPPALPPHPHTMKLGEFITHARLFGQQKLGNWLETGFSRVSSKEALDMITKAGIPKSKVTSAVGSLTTEDFKKLFASIQDMELRPPSTQAVMAVGEEALSMSIQRLGAIDYFAVVSRKPMICDFKPVQVEVAIARLSEKAGESEESVQILRFANRVPLQFDKAACAIVKAIGSVNWKVYGLKQTRGLLPAGPYIIAVSVISPFIKFKNASKETVDASDELVEEIRRALMKAGLNLSRHLRRESKAHELEAKRAHIEKFSPILVATLCRILEAPKARQQRAEEGLRKILGRDNQETKKELLAAEEKLSAHLEMQKQQIVGFFAEDEKLKHSHEDGDDVDQLKNTERPRRRGSSKIDEIEVHVNSKGKRAIEASSVDDDELREDASRSSGKKASRSAKKTTGNKGSSKTAAASELAKKGAKKLPGASGQSKAVASSKKAPAKGKASSTANEKAAAKSKTATKAKASTKSTASSKGKSSTKSTAAAKGKPSTKSTAASKGKPSTKSTAAAKGKPSTKSTAASKGKSSTKSTAASKGKSSTKSTAASKGKSSTKSTAASKGKASTKSTAATKGKSPAKDTAATKGKSPAKSKAASTKGKTPAKSKAAKPAVKKKPAGGAGSSRKKQGKKR